VCPDLQRNRKMEIIALREMEWSRTQISFLPLSSAGLEAGEADVACLGMGWVQPRGRGYVTGGCWHFISFVTSPLTRGACYHFSPAQLMSGLLALGRAEG
jgi:hypothetical protein